eukprot:3704350-Karenia_brevis.AAC.1
MCAVWGLRAGVLLRPALPVLAMPCRCLPLRRARAYSNDDGDDNGDDGDDGDVDDDDDDDDDD